MTILQCAQKNPGLLSWRSFVLLALLASLVVLPGAAVAKEEGVDQRGPVGPDVIVGELPSVRNWGSVGSIHAFSVATTSCNKGDATLLWQSDNPNHPVIGQNLYRVKDDRIENVGISWLKHGFLALAGNACGFGCQNPGSGALLGVGCSDPYGSTLNGSHSRLGPRFEVNAFTGAFLWPYTDQGAGGNDIYKRLQVHEDDLDPSLNVGATYYIEGHYVTPDDATFGNHMNNASYSEVTVSGTMTLSLSGGTVREKAAIFAWQTEDPTVDIVDVDVAGDGRFYVATKVRDNGDGTWRYSYAVHNLNNHRSAQSFSVPVDASVTVTGVGFYDPEYHSGEPYDNTDWTSMVGGGMVTWSGDTEATNADANALRWGTMYTFWFDADVPPASNSATLTMFRAGSPGSVSFTTQAPDSDSLIFGDGFTSGDTDMWDVVQP